MLNRRNFLGAGALLAGSAAGAQKPDSDSVRIWGAGALVSFDCSNGNPLRLRALRNSRSGFDWCSPGGIVEPIYATDHLDLANHGDGRNWVVAKWRVKPGSAQEFHLEYAPVDGVAARQQWSLLSSLPILEIRSEFDNAASQSVAAVTSFGPFRIPLRSDLGPLQVHCVRRNSYSLESIPLDDSLELNGGQWNGPEHCGLLALEAVASKEFLFMGIEWERGWQYRLERKQDALWLEVKVADLRHDQAGGEKIVSPRVFIGLTSGSFEDAVRLTHRYLKQHVFPKPLGNFPWVVYDIWGTESQGVEGALLNEIDAAADLGVELFYVDASWYRGSSRKGTGDWGCGLGNYSEDREKFPRGLAYLSDRVHARGMKFGLWVGPNIVDSRLVPNTIPKAWLARFEGKDRVLTIKAWESTCHQVCLGCREYIEHLKTNLARIVEEFHLDWLKWDNSGIPGIPGRCDRADHGHQAGDGSYAALVGQYEIFDFLHSKFPDLVLEQCGYGSRLDYGLARTIRANWMSDASFPSSHVRENALVGSYIYPAYYNGGWVLKDAELDKTLDPATLDSIFRSRMMGLFGFGTLHGKLPERISLFPPEALDAARRNIPLYKSFRHLLLGDAFHLFPPLGSPEQWQAVQFANEAGSESVVLCFRGKSAQSSMRLPLQGLMPSRQYTVTSASKMKPRQLTGKQLATEGLISKLATPEMSEIYFLRS